jgi:hypothetical protein
MVKEINYTLLLIAVAFILNACDSKEKRTEVNGKDTNIVAFPDQEANATASKSSLPLTTIAFADTSFDFGKIDEGKKVSHVFKFKNTGNNPLVIESARPSCGCTVTEYTKDTIAPGADGMVNATYDSKDRNGQINKTIDVSANTDPRITTLKISAFVLDKKQAGPYNK